MSAPASLREQLIRDEGLRLFPYRDTTGHLTIGIGRNLTTKGISLDEAEMMLDHDITTTTQALMAALPWLTTLDPIRGEVLQNMAFNLGVTGLLGFTHALEAIRTGDFPVAARALLESRWATQVHDRARRLATQLQTGVRQ